MLIVNLFDKNIELFIAFADMKLGEEIKLKHLWYIFVIKCAWKTFFEGDSFMFSNIVLYLKKKQMSKTQAKKLSLQFIPYLFIVVTILTAFGFNSGTWAWMISILVV